MNLARYFQGREYIESMAILIENDKYVAALTCGSVGLKFIEETYFDIRNRSKNNNEFGQKDFIYSRESLNKLISKLNVLLKRIMMKVSISKNDIELVNIISKEIADFLDRVCYLERKYNQKLLGQRIKMILKKVAEISLIKSVRFIFGVCLVFCSIFLIVSIGQRYFQFRPTYKLYRASSSDEIFCSGWSSYDSKLQTRWNNKPVASIIVQFPLSDRDQVLNLIVSEVMVSLSVRKMHRQKVIAYIGNELLGSISITTPGLVSFKVPHELITSKNTRIDLVFPNAEMPFVLGRGPERQKVSVRIDGFFIDNYDSAPYYKCGTKISALSNSDNKYFAKGWDVPDFDGRWAVDGVSEVLLKTPDKIGMLQLELRIAKIFEYTAEQRLKVFINERFLDERVLDNKTDFVLFNIPREYYAYNNSLRIRFESPDAVNPMDLGLWDDNRKLSFALKSLRIK